MTATYVAIAECPEGKQGTWWVSFPGFPGVTTAADTSGAILSRARDALVSALEGLRAMGQEPPETVEAGGLPTFELTEYERPLVLLVPIQEMTPAV